MSGVISLSEIAEQMRIYIKREDETLWDQGDYLVRVHPTDHQFRKLAEMLNRTEATLRTRQRVANEFTPEIRTASAYTVYVELLKVTDAYARARILAKRPDGEWTIKEMQMEVSGYLRSIGATRTAQQPHSAGLRLGDYRVRAELGPAGLELAVTPYDGEADAVVSKIPGKLIITIPSA